MLLAPEVFYASPAALRRSWQAPDAPADVVILLDGARHHGEAFVERVSEGEAALQAARMLIGGASGISKGEQAETMVQVVEAMRGVTAYRAGGTPPAAVASALELELAA